ncbi:MAG TPA: T9SS type A sorting domain-containing protein, partial [Candidatus Nitrosotenuis sp.]|nr:T9SS type A sorting domain-containing protein [Candidatus Nitrosotenuis sp.]
WGPSIKSVGLISSISMSDSLNGWAVANSGTLGLIHKTSDGGQSWVKTRELFDDYYQSTKSYSPEKNITSGYYTIFQNTDTVKVLNTVNNGTAWTEKKKFNTKIFRTFVIDSLRVFAVISGGSLLRTTDGGDTWEQFPSIGPHSMFFLDTLKGWANNGGEIYRTYDGGKSWNLSGNLQDTIQGQGTLLGSDADGGITFLDSLTGWTFGGCFYNHDFGGQIQKTTDGGKTWRIEVIGISSLILSGMMIDKTHGWGVTYDGKVLGYVPKSLGVKKLPELPKGFVLRQNYPNPFNPVTTIEYEIPRRCGVTITVYDIAGKRIKTLVSEEQEAGVYQVKFDATHLSSGTYFYELKTETYKETKSLTIIK